MLVERVLLIITRYDLKKGIPIAAKFGSGGGGKKLPLISIAGGSY